MSGRRKASGGSTLRHLKSGLKNLGIIGKPKISKKKHAKIAAGEKDDRANRLKSLNQQANPFELKINRKKHDVLGKKDRGLMGKPGLSRKAGLDNV